MKTTGMRAGVAVATALLLAACGEQPAGPRDTVAQGELVYKNVCIACHDADPAKPGALGPAVAGASRELIAARVIHGNYPEGYEPEQGGALMPQFPHLEGSIDDLAAYLGQLESP
jgi:mono/diheme cytochrome c family protein